ncbi:uncharacterized protein LOC135330760 [Halichondria panicea]|uniref:uncharacterized protein LOC135330760 n=2 Tax=Halichondria panicea TaxID=6063 RepID=UPI00312B7FC1
MASTVNLIRNVLTSQYLTHNGSSVAVHHLKNHSNNFHLYDDGPLRRLQVFSDSNKKISHVPAGGCSQGLTTNPSGSMVHVTPNSSVGVKLFVKDGSGNRYYLRVNIAQSSNVELVCQSHVDNAQYNPFLRQELEFDLVTVDINDLY